jgi:hypothetical protein
LDIRYGDPGAEVHRGGVSPDRQGDQSQNREAKAAADIGVSVVVRELSPPPPTYPLLVYACLLKTPYQLSTP